jgi:hypothetical protein
MLLFEFLYHDQCLGDLLIQNVCERLILDMTLDRDRSAESGMLSH